MGLSTVQIILKHARFVASTAAVVGLGSGCIAQEVTLVEPQSKSALHATNPTPTPSPSPTTTPSPAPVTQTINLSNGKTSILLKGQLNEIGNVYYAVYDSDPGTLTPSALKSAALAGVSGSRVAAGTLSIPSANTQFTQTISSLADNKRYVVFAVGEGSSNNLASAAKKYSEVLPRRLSMQSFPYAGPNGAQAGKLIRYYVYYPPGYYESPSSTYPMIFYTHGCGELPGACGNPSASDNAETWFTTGNQNMKKAAFSLYLEPGLLDPSMDGMAKDLPFVVIQPQCNGSLFSCYSEHSWTNHVWDTVSATYRIDLKRRYLTGMSQGGQGAWTMAINYPTKVAAVAPIAAVSPGYAASAFCALPDNGVGVWAFHNANDSAVSPTANTFAGYINACASAVGNLRARSIQFPGNIQPATFNNHNTFEYVYGAPHYNYSYGMILTPATTPAANAYYFALEPAFVSGLATASADHGTQVDDLWEWFMLWAKP